MIISENPYGKENCVAFFTASAIGNYQVLSADEHFYHFAGKVTGLSILDIIHPDHIKDFKRVFDSLKSGETSRMIIMLKSNTKCYYWADILISNNNKIMAGEPSKEVRGFLLSAVESRYLLSLDNVNKYRALLALYNNYLFDYKPNNGEFTVYHFQGTQSNSVMKGDLDEIHDKIIAMYEDDAKKAEFEKFYENLKNTSKVFTGTVSLPTDVEFKEFHRFKVNTSISYTSDKNMLVSGILELDEDGVVQEVPYYATKAAIDSQTGLLNKKASTEYTNDIIASYDRKPHYMVVFDVDNFKNINDNYGHFFGDEVLQKVADVIKRNLNGRGITGRFGGDEFYLFTNNIDTEEDLRVLLTTMRRELMYAYEGVVDNLKVTLSIGVSLYPVDGNNYEDLFKKADKCLYLAKEKGRNRFIIYDENKHGNIEDQGRHVHKVLNLAEHAEYMADLISDMVIKLNTVGKDAVPEIMEALFTQMELDGVRIYKNLDLVDHYGTYKDIPDMRNVITDELFLKKYNANRTLSVGNIVSAEAWHKPFYENMSACNIMACISFWYEFNDNKYYFFYDIFNHKSRWNDSDKNYLLIVSKTIAKVLS